MTDQERSQIRSYQLGGLTPKQISELTGISQNTVKVHCHRYPVSNVDIADHKGLCRHCGRPLIQTPHKKAKRYCSDKCRIQKHPGWQYCGVYADEALTGTKDNRENFQRLLIHHYKIRT